MKIGEECWAVVSEDGHVAGNGECEIVYRADNVGLELVASEICSDPNARIARVLITEVADRRQDDLRLQLRVLRRTLDTTLEEEDMLRQSLRDRIAVVEKELNDGE